MIKLANSIVLVGCLFGLASCSVTNASGLQPSANSVFTSSSLIGLLIKFESGAEVLRIPANQRYFTGLAVRGQELLVSDLLANVIRRLTPTGVELAPFALVESPMRLESDRSGNYYNYSLGYFPTQITRFDFSGRRTLNVSIPAFINLSGIDADSKGNIYVSSTGTFGVERSLIKLSSTGSLLNITPLPDIIPSDIAIDEAANRLFLVDEFRSDINVRSFDISGVTPVYLGGFSARAIARVNAISIVEESGNLLLAGDGQFGDLGGWAEYTATGELIASHKVARPSQLTDIVAYSIPEPNSICSVLFAAVYCFALSKRWS